MTFDARSASSVLLAAALGDALGLPLEIKGAEPRGSWLENLEGVSGLSVGGVMVYSDDTEMMLILGESIVENCGFNPQAFAEHMARRARTWDPIRNYGVGVAEVIEAVRKGVDWRLAARQAWGGQGSFGNGAAVRVPPITIFYTTRDSVELMAVAQAMVTHVHPLGIEGARLAALAIYYLSKGLDVTSLPRLLRREAIREEFKERLELVDELLDASPERVAKSIGNGGAAYETLAAAVYVLVRSEADLEKTIAYALSLGGDTDSIAALAAALAATVNPQGLYSNMRLARLLSTLEDRDEIEELGVKLIKARVRCSEQLF